MSTRRAFFLGGGAAAAATTIMATTTAVAGEERISQQELLDAKDREAIREALGELFANRECWQNLSRREELTLHGRERATATVHFEVEECTPLEGHCTVVEMARLQGNMADRRWVARRVEVDFVRIESGWRMSGMRECM